VTPPSGLGLFAAVSGVTAAQAVSLTTIVSGISSVLGILALGAVGIGSKFKGKFGQLTRNFK